MEGCGGPGAAGTLALTAPCFFLQSDIGFGKLETYVKLDKLGEVRAGCVFSGDRHGLCPPQHRLKRDAPPPWPCILAQPSAGVAGAPGPEQGSRTE